VSKLTGKNLRFDDPAAYEDRQRRRLSSIIGWLLVAIGLVCAAAGAVVIAGHDVDWMERGVFVEALGVMPVTSGIRWLRAARRSR
jgi:hypothetical protein